MKVLGNSKHKFHVQKLPLPLPPPAENHAVYGIMWKKSCRSGQDTDDSTVHAHCTLDA